jgi:hypothetical protein
MTIRKTTPYACANWHKEDNWERVKKVTFQKDKLTYCIDSNYDILCAEMSFDKAYSIAIENRAYFEYDKISNKDLQYMSDILYRKATNMLKSHDYKYSNESARNIYDDITKCMKIHDFISPVINFATLTTIENIIKKVNEHIAENGFVGLDMEIIVRKELSNEYHQLNDEMQEKIKHIMYKEQYTYWSLDEIIKQISENDKKGSDKDE